MDKFDYSHFRVQSSNSLLSSTLKIKKICDLAKSNKMSSIALTDYNNLFGSLEFSITARENRTIPIHGAILTLNYTDRDINFKSEVLLLAKSAIGYQNLIKLVSNIYCSSKNRSITLNNLRDHKEGLICLSGYIDGPIGIALLKENSTLANTITMKLKDIFHDCFYAEIMRHGLEKEKQIERKYLDVVCNHDLPLIATNKVLFASQNDYESHDILLCIANGKRESDPNRIKSHKEYYFKSSDQMKELFHDLPSAIENASLLVQRCAHCVDVAPPSLPKCIEGDEEQLLRDKSLVGLKKRIKNNDIQEQDHKSYFNRLEYELKVICEMNFARYFLIVSDFVSWSKTKNIPVGPGRGSGAGSIIAWSLGITDLDPIKYDLIFERFLNPDRISMPDFDIDFCQERRHEVIEYVKNKYGNDRVGQIITFGTLQPKAVIKDVARVLDVPFYYAKYLSDLIPFNAVNPITLNQALQKIPELKSIYAMKDEYLKDLNSSLDPQEAIEMNSRIHKVLKVSLVLEGLHRHVSIHAAGIIICGEELMNRVALYKNHYEDSMNVIQYSMKNAEKTGLIKFDFLGLQTLTTIDKTLIQINKNSSKAITITDIPIDDDITFRKLSNGNSLGVFQFEGKGLMNELRRLNCRSVADLMDLTSLYRPGPMENIPVYLACKQGQQEVEYMHSSLKTILEGTYGVIIYQEQVIKIAQVFAGYSLGQADILRNVVGKKILSEMGKHRSMFIEGAIKKHKVSKDLAEKVFSYIVPFAGYGFNRAHAASYAFISYITAYLKANYLIDFLVASMNSELHNHDRLSDLIYDAMEYGITVLPPCINQSKCNFFYNNNKQIIYGLGAIKAVAVNMGQQIEKTRLSKFDSIENFIVRTSRFINKKSLEALMKAGAFDAFHDNRKELFDSIELMLERVNRQKENSMQLDLLSTSNINKKIFITHGEHWNIQQKSFNEFQALGIFLTCHPISIYEEYFDSKEIFTSKKIKEKLIVQGRYQIKTVAVIEQKIVRIGNKGKQFVILKVSDQYGKYEVTVFDEELQKKYGDLLKEKSIVILGLDVVKTSYSLNIILSNINSTFNIIKQFFSKLDLYVKDRTELRDLRALISNKMHQEGIEINILIPFDECFMVKCYLGKFNIMIDDLSKIKKWLIE